MTARWVLYAAITVTAGVMGTNIYNSVIDAPSWGASIPQSLEVARQYFSTGTPGRFFRVASPLAQGLMLLALIVCWKYGPAIRGLAAAALAFVILADVLTFVYFYPRNDIMFVNILDAEAATRAWRGWSTMTHIRSAMACAAVVCELMVLSRIEQLSR